MNLNFANLALGPEAASNERMRFLRREPLSAIAEMMQVCLVEFARPDARVSWQQAQINNLMQHASDRSSFWRRRLESRDLQQSLLDSLPMLRREELREQVAAEGALLLKSEEPNVVLNATSGSSGIPVQFYRTPSDVRYAGLRSGAQFLIEGLRLDLNRTKARLEINLAEGEVSTIQETGWMGELSPYCRGGINRTISYHPAAKGNLAKEIVRQPIGYLVANPWFAEVLLQHTDVPALIDAGLQMWIVTAGSAHPDLRNEFLRHGVPVRANYSSEEFGPIGFECAEVPGSYHVASSNVVVEMEPLAIRLEGRDIGRLMITGLHSYATPLIRYEIGDLGCVEDSCECGHQGPTISALYGRQRELLKRPDGTVSVFILSDREILKAAACSEFRVTQKDNHNLELEVGGSDCLSAGEKARLEALLRKYAGPEMNITIIARDRIDWGNSWKRLAFRGLEI